MGVEVSEYTAARLLTEFDPDGSGAIDVEEFRVRRCLCLVLQLFRGEDSGYSIVLPLLLWRRHCLCSMLLPLSSWLRHCLGSLCVASGEDSGFGLCVSTAVLAKTVPFLADFQEMLAKLQSGEAWDEAAPAADAVQRIFEDFDTDGQVQDLSGPFHRLSLTLH